MGSFLWFVIVISLAGLSLSLYDLYRTFRAPVGIPSSPSSFKAPGTVEPSSRLRPKDHYDLIAKRNIFAFPEQKGSSPNSETRTPEPEVTDLRVRLRGTVVAPPEFSVAVIEDPSTRKEDLYIVGDRLHDAEIVEILKDRVLLRRQGRVEVLKLFEEKEGRARGGAQAKFSPRRSSSHVDRGALLRAGGAASSRRIQQKIRSLMAQLRLRPHFEGGKPAGFRIGRVGEGSVFQAAGLREGDIIVAINDEDVRTPNQLLKAYREVAEDEELWLDIIRGGEEETVEIDIEGILP